jgi:hypothetical protein
MKKTWKVGKLDQLIGNRFGQLLIIDVWHTTTGHDGRLRAVAKCVCDCGITLVTRIDGLNCFLRLCEETTGIRCGF